MAWGLIVICVFLVPLSIYAIIDLIDEIRYAEIGEPFFPVFDGCDVWIDRGTRDKLQAAADALEDGLDDHEDLADTIAKVVSIWDWQRAELTYDEEHRGLRVLDGGAA